MSATVDRSAPLVERDATVREAAAETTPASVELGVVAYRKTMIAPQPKLELQPLPHGDVSDRMPTCLHTRQTQGVSETVLQRVHHAEPIPRSSALPIGRS